MNVCSPSIRTALLLRSLGSCLQRWRCNSHPRARHQESPLTSTRFGLDMQRGKSRKESESSYMKNLNANTQAAISTSLQVLKRKRRFFKALCPQLESAQLRLVTSSITSYQFNSVLFVLHHKSSCLRAPAGVLRDSGREKICKFRSNSLSHKMLGNSKSVCEPECDTGWENFSTFCFQTQLNSPINTVCWMFRKMLVFSVQITSFLLMKNFLLFLCLNKNK